MLREFARQWGRVLDTYSGRDEMEDFEPDPRWAEVLGDAVTGDSSDQPTDLPLFHRKE
jgi:hypothetical protein